jgi:co-chaperonin GroES (HSP10)
VQKVEEKTAGGIVIPDSSLKTDQGAVSEGILVKKGITAFDYLPEHSVPQIGDKVYFVKYSGINKELNDEFYRILNDVDVVAWGDINELTK